MAREVQSAGGQWNAYTAENRTVYYIDGPAESFERFAKVLAGLVFYPTFPEEDFEREKEVIRREIAMYDDDEESRFHDLHQRTCWRVSPRKWPIIGYRSQFDRITRDDVIQYHARRYAPCNVIVSIAGAVDEASVVTLIEELTSSLDSSRYQSVEVAAEPALLSRRSESSTFPSAASRLRLSWRIPASAYGDFPALDALAKILGYGRTAWLEEKFHDQMGLALDISASFQRSYDGDSVWSVSAEVDPENRDVLRDHIIEELERLSRAGDFTNAGATLLRFGSALKRLVQCELASRINAMVTASGQARLMAHNWFYQGDPQADREWFEALGRVEPTSLPDALARWIVGRPHVEVVQDPEGYEPSGISDESGDLDESGERSGAIAEEVSGESTRSEPVLRVLPNGLRVVITRDTRLPVARVALKALGASLAENSGNAGVSALLAECMPKGTHSRSATAVAEFLEDLGGSIDTESGINTIGVSATLLAGNMAEALELVADVALNPELEEDAIIRERDQMIALIEEERQDPLSLAFERGKALMYGDSGYGLPSMGTPETLSALTREDLLAFHSRIFVSSNCVLSVYGDIDEQEVLELAGRYFADMPQGQPVACGIARPVASSETRVKLAKQQGVLLAGYSGLALDSPDYDALSLLSAWCSDMAGPLFTEIREQRGLAYYTGLATLTGPACGGLVFYVGTDPARLGEATQALDAVIERISRDGMSEEELESVKTSMLARIALGNQQPGKICSELALEVLFGFSLDHFSQLPERVRSVTTGQVQSMASRLLAPGVPRVILEVTPQA